MEQNQCMMNIINKLLINYFNILKDMEKLKFFQKRKSFLQTQAFLKS